MIAMEAIGAVLSASGLRAARFTAMHELIEAGYSGRRALEWLRKFSSADAPLGLGIRTQTFYQFWTPLRQIHSQVGRGVLVRLGDIPGAGTMTRTPFEQVRRYNYIVDITGTDLETGLVDTRKITIASDVLMSKGRIQAEAVDVVLTDRERYGWEGEIRASFSSGTIQKGAPFR